MNRSVFGSVPFRVLAVALVVEAGLLGPALSRPVVLDAECARLKDAKEQVACWTRKAKGGEKNLMGANLVEANLHGVNLTGVNLAEANLKGADLGQANLTNANLINANLRAADLRGANLTGSVRKGTRLQDIKTDANTKGL